MVPADRHPLEPPSGPWVMVQRWHDLLFAHWRCPISDLPPLIPQPLEIETYDGDAWISVIPFYMSGVRMDCRRRSPRHRLSRKSTFALT